MLRLLVQAAASMLDPISLAGWIVAGLVVRRSVWAGLGVVAAWSLAIEAFVAAVAAQEQSSYQFGQLLPARLIAGVVVCGVVAVIARVIQRRQALP